jgi:hypothetical protein
LAFMDAAAPYEYTFTAPTTGSTFSVRATAADFGGNIATTATVMLALVPDPLTTVVGRVVSAGQPIAGASVATSGNFVSSTAADGTFVIAGVPTARGPIVVNALATIGGLQHRGMSGAHPPVSGGTTNVGDIEVVLPNFVIPANPLWTSTGIVLTAGQTVQLTASGSWSWGGGFFGPDGDPNGPVHSDDFQHFDATDKGRLIAYVGADPYQGRWGDGGFFPQPSGYVSIGSLRTFTTTVSGTLWLGFNDGAVSGGASDNGGSVNVSISVR